MGNRKTKRLQRVRHRRQLNLGGTHAVTFYVVRFMAKVPDELREGTDAPEWIKRESPPTLSEEEARDAYQTVLDQLMTQHSGVRSPQLVVRTVTEDVVRDYDQERARSMADAMAEDFDARNAAAGAR